jgi:truncated hemoglobin YjbI
MKNIVLPLVLVLAVSVTLFGCGKSAEMKKMEADLFASVKTMHDEGMGLMMKANELTGRIDEAIATFDKLAADHPKETAGHNADDLKAARQKLSGAVASMKEWMAGFKPYDEKTVHEEAMAQLAKTKEGITKVKDDFNSAIAAASKALDSQKTFADDMTAKTGKKGAKK